MCRPPNHFNEMIGISEENNTVIALRRCNFCKIALTANGRPYVIHGKLPDKLKFVFLSNIGQILWDLPLLFMAEPL